MKKILLMMCLSLGGMITKAQNWQFVGSPDFSAGAVANTSIAVDGNTPYVVYQDYFNSYRTTVKKHNGFNWIAVGNEGFSAGPAPYNSIAINNHTPYVAYQDAANNSKATLVKFDGTTWVPVGNPGFSAGYSEYISLAFNGNTPYVAYKDAGNSGKLTVMKYDGNNWVNVGSAGFTSEDPISISLAFDGNVPYVAYQDGGNSSTHKANVMKFNDTNWVTVGNANFSSGTSNYTSLAINNHTPYVVYADGNNNDKATVMKYDGTNWINVGPASGFSAHGVAFTSIAFNGNTPYVSFLDYNVNYSNKANVMKFDGTNWVYAGNPNFSPGASVYNFIASSNNSVYVVYADVNNNYGATVMKLDVAAPCNPTASTTNINVCSNLLPYHWNGNIYANAGSYTINLTNKAGCDSAATLNLTVNASPASATIYNNNIAVANNIVYCSNGSQNTLYASVKGGTWSSSNINIVTVTNGGSGSAITTPNNGNAVITYTLANNNGCSSTTDINITVAKQATPNAITGSTSVCPGDVVTYTTTSAGGVWILNGKGTINNAGVVTYNSAGSASIEYKITNASNCSASYLLPVTINATPAVPDISYAPGNTINPQAGAPSGSMCKNRTFSLAGTPAGGMWDRTGVFSVTNTGVVSTGNVAGSGTISYAINSNTGCKNIRTLSFNVAACATKGISSQQPANNSFTVYPNPAHSVINLKTDRLVSGNIIVTDLYGKQVKYQLINIGTNTIDVSNFAKGIYFVSMVTEQGKQTQKVVVE